MKNILFILLFTIPFFGIGQGWEKIYGGTSDEWGSSVQQTNDGGYIISGSKSFFKVSLIKTDNNGDSLWTKTFDGDIGYSVQQTNDGGYIITGVKSILNSSFNLEGDVFLIKTNGNGDSLWTKTYGGTENELGRSIQQTNDGGYIITGYTNSFGNGTEDLYLIKTDNNGDSLWTKTYGDTNGEEGYSVQQTNDGGYIITGVKSFFSNGFTLDVYLIKTDENGDSLWTKTYGGTSNETGSSVQQTNDGGYIITGSTWSFGNGLTDVFLIKTDNNGDSLWTKTFGGTGRETGSSVQQTNDGGYIITGSTQSFGNGLTDVYLIKTDNNGDSLWTKTFGGIDDDNGSSVQQTNDGGYIITGNTSSFGNGDRDIYIIKTDGNGNVTSTFNIPILSTNRKLENIVDILGRDVKPQPNTPFIEIYDDGSTEKKIIIE
jgi:regulation of enolase protein 1 (concanavalin A-like superfamily)